MKSLEALRRVWGLTVCGGRGGGGGGLKPGIFGSCC